MPRLLFLASNLLSFATIALLLTATASAMVDISNPEPVLPSGGISGIMMSYPWSKGMITYPPSRIAVGTTVIAIGYAEPIRSLALLPGARVVLYSIMFNVRTQNVKGREIRTLYSTRPPAILSFNFSPSVDPTKGLDLHVLHVQLKGHSNTAKWNGPILA